MEDLTQQLEQRRADQARNEANRAGNAASFAIFQTTGVGAHEFPDAIDFVLAFQEEPIIQYGHYCNGDALTDLLDMDDDDIPPYPMSSGFVTEWIQDENDFYTGCFVGVRVTFPTDIYVDNSVPVILRHYFRFEAIGLKGIV